MQVRSGRLRLHSAVDKADQVRKMVIAEQPGDGLFAELNAPGLEQTVGIGWNAVRIAKEAHIQRPAKHAFIRAEPLKTFLGCDGKGLMGDGALGWPNACWLHAKRFLMILARELQLLAGVFGPAERAARKRSPGIRNARDVGIANKRQNGVIKRGRADF